MVYFIRVGFLILMTLYVKLRKRTFNFYEKEKKQLLFNGLLGLSLEGFFEFLISGYLNYKKEFNYSTVNGERISTFVAYSCLL